MATVTGEISFATNEILGMSVQGNAVPTPAKGWKYESCLLSINTKTGTAIAQKQLPLNRPRLFQSAI